MKKIESFRINQDRTVDIVLDISRNDIITVSGDVCEEISYALADWDTKNDYVSPEIKAKAKKMTDAMFGDNDSQLVGISTLSKDEDKSLNDQAEWQRQAERDAVERDMKGDDFCSLNRDDTDYDNAKQDGLL